MDSSFMPPSFHLAACAFASWLLGVWMPLSALLVTIRKLLLLLLRWGKNVSVMPQGPAFLHFGTTPTDSAAVLFSPSPMPSRCESLMGTWRRGDSANPEPFGRQADDPCYP